MEDKRCFICMFVLLWIRDLVCVVSASNLSFVCFVPLTCGYSAAEFQTGSAIIRSTITKALEASRVLLNPYSVELRYAS